MPQQLAFKQFLGWLSEKSREFCLNAADVTGGLPVLF